MTAGVLAIVLGGFGVHKFYLGRTTPGIILLVLGVVSTCCGLLTFVGFFGLLVTSTIGVIEGVLILTKSDEEFERVYVDGQKEWF